MIHYLTTGLRAKRAMSRALGAIIALVLVSLPGWAEERAEPTDAEVIPPEVYQEAVVLRGEIEQIRQFLGRRAPRERSYRLADAVPRQTFYQAQTLFRKSNQLAQEIAGASRERPPAAPDRDVVPGDVLSMLQAARRQIGFVKAELGITEELTAPKLQRRRTPSDVMGEIIEAGDILNQLTDKDADWTDIYDRVLQMVTYTAGVLPEAQRYPELPDNVCCKQPQEVYQSLSASLTTLAPLAKSVDFSLVRVIPKKQAEGGASVDTVFDLTTTMVSDIAEITLRLKADEDTEAPNYPRPKRILPSDVFRLTSVLQQQWSLAKERK